MSRVPPTVAATTSTAGPARPGHRRERGRVDEFQVVDGQGGRRGEDLPGGGQHRPRAVGSPGRARAQRPGQRQRIRPGPRPRGRRSGWRWRGRRGSRTVGTDSMTTPRSRSLTMRRISTSCCASFCAEHRDVRAGQAEQFQPTVSTPSKKPGRNLPSRTWPPGPGSTVTCGLPGRVHLGGGRREDEPRPLLGAHGQVGIQRPRIPLQILAGPELKRVDEDRHHHAPRWHAPGSTGQLPGRPQQGAVPGVQRAHGGDQDDGRGQARSRDRELVPRPRQHRRSRAGHLGPPSVPGSPGPPSTPSRRSASAGLSRPAASARSAVSRAMAT